MLLHLSPVLGLQGVITRTFNVRMLVLPFGFGVERVWCLDLLHDNWQEMRSLYIGCAVYVDALVHSLWSSLPVSGVGICLREGLLLQACCCCC